jgi:putative copper export protein
MWADKRAGAHNRSCFVYADFGRIRAGCWAKSCADWGGTKWYAGQRPESQAALLVFFVVQAAVAANVPLTQAIGAPALQLLRGRSGLLWLARISLTLLIMLIGWHAPPIGQGATRHWWVALVLAGAALLTFSLSGHSAALPDAAAIAVALDWLHIMAMVAWLGGLIPLFLAIGIARGASERVLSLRPLIPRFSRLAMICVTILTLTGVYSYLQQINNLDLLATTTYRQAFALKLGLFGLLLVLGAVNVFYLSPRMRATGNHLARAFGRSVRLELVEGALLRKQRQQRPLHRRQSRPLRLP